MQVWFFYIKVYLMAKDRRKEEKGVPGYNI